MNQPKDTGSSVDAGIKSRMSREALEREVRTLREQIDALTARLDESEQTLDAIRNGEVDALVVAGPQGERIYTLEGADESYRILVEQMDEGAVTLTRDGMIRYCNQYMADMLGLPLERAIGAAMREHVAASSRETFDDLVRQSEQDSARVELTLAAAGGRQVPVYMSLCRMTSEEGTSLCATVTDLSAQKRSEQVLASERFTRAILGQAADGIVACDAEGRLTFINATARRRARQDPAGARLEDLERIWGRLSLADGTSVGPDEWPISKALRGEVTSGQEVRHVHPDGTDYHLLLGASPVRGDDGTILGAVATFTDITKRKAAEQALRESEGYLRTLADAMPQLVWTARPDGTLDFFNQRHREFMGLHKVADGQWEWGPMMHPEDQPATVEAWQRALRTGKVHQMEHRVQMADGTYRWHLTRAVPVGNDKGEIVRWYGTATDVHDARLAREQLRTWNEDLEERVAQRTAEAEQRAVQLQRLAGQLSRAEQKERQRLAEILHDHLQQLLVGAKFSLNIARAQATDPSVDENLQQVNDLLDESLDASRSLTVELSPPILHQGRFRDVLDWLSRWMRDKHGLTVDVDVPDEIVALTDEVKVLLFQAVRELLFNIVKHAGTDRARVSMAMVSPETVRVSVSDDGAGFDPAAAHDDQGDGGSGFGLFSVRERLEMLGGQMAIASQPGEGTEITLLVPCCAEEQEHAPHVPARPRPVADKPAVPPYEQSAKRRIRVLLADDHHVVRDGLARLIARQPDIEVVGQASDGHEALEMAERLRPDVVLMDVNMPGITGISATRRIRESMGDVQVIGLSMFEAADVAARMMRAGAAAYLAKTSPPDRLIETIRECVQVGEVE